MKYLLLLISIFCILFSCSNENRTPNISNDFESLGHWAPNTTQLVTGDAHTGKYSCMVDSNNIYSLTYKGTLKESFNKAISKIEAGVWIKSKNANAKGTLVITIEDTQGVKKYWKGFDTTTLAGDTWTYLHGETEDLSNSNLTASDQLFIFFNNTSKEEILIDDFEIFFTQ